MAGANVTRRDWLRHAAVLGAAVATSSLAAGRGVFGAAGGEKSAPTPADTPAKAAESPAKVPCRASLTAGNNRGDNVLKALKPFEKELREAIGNRRVVLKPNNVSTDNQLSATHADTLAAVLEFLKSIGKL
jgi:hypothetical protein